jgi:hypothetical protein
MLSVLKQEFFIHKKNIFLTSMLLLGLYVVCLILGCLNQVIESDKITDLTAMWLGFSMMIGSFGIFFIALLKGSGSMNDILFKDTGTLMKTVPVSSWALVGGKMIIGFLEFVIYAAISSIFAIACGLFAWFDVKKDPDFILSEYGNMSLFEFLENAIELSEIIPEILTLVCIVLLAFIILQAIINFAMTLYATFGKNTRRGKILIGVAIYFILYAILRTVGSFLDVINFRFLDDIMDLWIPMGIFTVIGAGLYAATCILYEKKVNI